MSPDLPEEAPQKKGDVVEKAFSRGARPPDERRTRPARSSERSHLADKRIGEILVENGAMKEHDIARVLDFAKSKRLPFGEAAVKLRLISREERSLAVAAQFDYPYLRKGERGYSKSLVAAFDPFSRKGEAVRQLCNQMLMHRTDLRHWLVGIFSANDSEASSYTASNLAVSLSQIGYQTLLVDGNLTDGRQHDIFNVHNTTGLSSLLVGRSDIDSTILRLPAFRGLSLLPSGGMPPNAADLLSRWECQEAMSRMRLLYDVVIVDAPPSSGAGSEAMARVCDAAMLVMRCNRTHLAEAQATIASIRSSGTELIGSALVAL